MNNGPTERMAVAAVKDAIGNSESLDAGDIKEGDTGVSFDGSIKTFFDQGENQTEKYSTSIPVQVKGHNKSKSRKAKVSKSFSWEKKHLINALKEGGAILFVVDLLPDGRKVIQYADLLPVNIKQYLKDHSKKTVSIRLKPLPIKNPKPKIEAICRKFLSDRSIQQKLDYKKMLSPSVALKGETILHVDGKFSRDDIDAKLDNDDFYYLINTKTNQIESAFVGKPKEIVAGNPEANIATKNGPSAFRGFEMRYLGDHSKILTFGKAFSVFCDAGKITFKPTGRLSERIQQIEFAARMIKDKGFLIDGAQFCVSFKHGTLKVVNEWKRDLQKLSNDLKSMHILKDPNLNQWSSEDFKKASLLLSAMDGNPLPLNGHEAAYGNLKIGDLVVSYFFLPEENGFRVVDILRFDASLEKEGFLCMDGYGKNPTKNLLCLLHESFYLSDNFDFCLVANYIEKMIIDENAIAPLNVQGLWMIKAYDRTEDDRYLELANTLYDRLVREELNEENRNDLKLNQFQIKARKHTLSDVELKEIVRIKDSSKIEFIIIGCLILLEGFAEAKLKLDGLAEPERKWFEQFPIMKLLRHRTH